MKYRLTHYTRDPSGGVNAFCAVTCPDCGRVMRLQGTEQRMPFQVAEHSHLMPVMVEPEQIQIPIEVDKRDSPVI